MIHKSIRTSTFETNSSSSHSLVIGTNRDFLYDTSLIPDKDGNLVLTGGMFGREWRRYNDAKTKANYCAIDRFKNEMLIEVLKEQTSARNIIFAFTTNYQNDKPDDSWSSIDHQSVGSTHNVFKDKCSLKNFIFNKNSWLFTGSDESSAPINFFSPPDPVQRIKVRTSHEIALSFDLNQSFDDLEDEIIRKLHSLNLLTFSNGETKIDIKKNVIITEKRSYSSYLKQDNQNEIKFFTDFTKNSVILIIPLIQFSEIANDIKDIHWILRVIDGGAYFETVPEKFQSHFKTTLKSWDDKSKTFDVEFFCELIPFEEEKYDD